ncbi:MAG: coproporphyrinogen dehydrogenase HemZ [Eubacteriales bacterium]|nr:coproporphyrinogen dehydrogenase HemZ [Eubacteriales bacterium]
MMIQMTGHTSDFALSDVLRLFFGKVERLSPDKLAAGQEAWYLESLVHLSPKHQTGASAAQTDTAQVRTSLWLTADDQASNQPPFLIHEDFVPQESVRRELKRQLYVLLERITDVHFPWGSLTGVRPTQVVEQILAEDSSPEKAQSELVEIWRVSPPKADLAVRTSLSEQRVLAQLPADEPLIYAGIPFCPSRCAYCSFISQDAHRRKDQLEPYVDALLEEARRTFAALPVRSSAFYLGGGTPTSLPEPLLERLLTGLAAILPLTKNAEITVEAGRPDTLTAGNLSLLREFGATRICINPQTFHEKTLQRIGRHHSVEQIRTAMAMARKAGFDHINMDLIAGLPGETPEDFAQSLEHLLLLLPESVTIHTLALKRSSRLAQELDPSGQGDLLINRPDPALLEMVARAQDRLVETDRHPYYLYRQKDVAGGLENVGFALPGHECRYNVGMMSDRLAVIGLGSGAITKRVDGRKVSRVPNDKDIAHYIQRLDELVTRKLQLFAI